MAMAAVIVTRNKFDVQNALRYILVQTWIKQKLTSRTYMLQKVLYTKQKVLIFSMLYVGEAYVIYSVRI